jgi:hypothetical protein
LPKAQLGLAKPVQHPLVIRAVINVLRHGPLSGQGTLLDCLGSSVPHGVQCRHSRCLFLQPTCDYTAEIYQSLQFLEVPASLNPNSFPITQRVIVLVN